MLTITMYVDENAFGDRATQATTAEVHRKIALNTNYAGNLAFFAEQAGRRWRTLCIVATCLECSSNSYCTDTEYCSKQEQHQYEKAVVSEKITQAIALVWESTVCDKKCKRSTVIAGLVISVIIV